MAYILRSNETKELYIKAFEDYKILTGSYFKNIVCDCELGLINSLECVFKYVNISGCTFHFGRVNWRKISILNFLKTTNFIRKFNKDLLRILNLVFVPTYNMENEYKKLHEKNIYKKKF